MTEGIKRSEGTLAIQLVVKLVPQEQYKSEYVPLLDIDLCNSSIRASVLRFMAML